MNVSNFRYFTANFLFIVSCFPAWIKFYLCINNAASIQNKILKQIINQNKNSEYGKKYNFRNINNYEDWIKQVPIIEYENIEQYVKEKSSLTTNKIKLFEPTSGSSGFQKLIPYTEELRKEFQNGIKVWLFDLYIHNLSLLFYKSYWSISPKSKTNNKDIGFENDEEYFSKIEQKFLNTIMVKPDLSGNFLKNTKEMLIRERAAIGLISIWSPTFLESVLENELINFPNLKIISCWSDASSKIYAQKLSRKYAKVIIQPKGLLATEGITSFPLWNKGCIISYLSHFYEFLDKNGKVFLLQDIKQGEEYTVILTTSGGLYRYNTHDKIIVKNFYKNIPLIEFIGRDNNVSDFFGEKMSEGFVNNIFKELFDKQPEFAVLGFDKDKYTLFIEGNCSENLLEKYLQKNYHYKNCIELGQLKPATVKNITNGLTIYREYYLSKGMKLGDIKIKALNNSVCDIFKS